MFGMFAKEVAFDVDDLLQNMEDAFRENKFKISQKKTRGPVTGDGFKNNYFEINFGSKFYYVMIHVKINRPNKIVEVKTKATYHKDYNFSTCPHFYKHFKAFSDIFSVASVKDEADLWKVCKEYVDAITPSIHRDFEVFKEEVNKAVMGYEDTRTPKLNRGVTCMFDMSNKREVMFEEGIFDEESKEKLYNLTGDEYFLPQEAKDMFLF